MFPLCCAIMNSREETSVSANRVIRSRKHTKEEKREQRKRWRKRKGEMKNVAGIKQAKIAHLADNTCEDDLPAVPARPRIDRPSENGCNRRGSLMLQLAKQRLKKAEIYVPCQTQKKTTESRVSKLKELDSSHIKYCSPKPFGSGSYGDCFLATYRGIYVVVKQVKAKVGMQEILRAKKEVLHEGSVIWSLGDNEGKPLVFGVITKSTPVCLVMQFHGVDGSSLNLHQAAESKSITPKECINIFISLLDTIYYVHCKGYIHNDIKSNNVILERKKIRIFTYSY